MILALAACTFTPGVGWGAIDGGTLVAGLEPGAARDLGGGTILTDLAYAVTLTELRVVVTDIAMLRLSGGSAGSFDPADPPEGYTLCHGGHCHRDDGALIDYADIEAELAGDTATWEDVARWPLDTDADLLAGAEWTLDAIDTPVDQGDVSKLALNLGALRLVGSVETDTGTIPLDVTLDSLGEAATSLDLSFGRGEDPVLRFATSYTPDGTLLDGLDLTSLAEDGAITVTEVDDPVAIAILTTLLATEPVTTLFRSDWSS